MTLQAFHNKVENKTKVLDQLQVHYDADQIIKGTYWEDGKGCAVGCTVHSSNHDAYEKELGIPEWLARLEDYLFEELPNKKSKEFPIKFIEAIPVGFDQWTRIYHEFCVYLLTDIIQTDEDEKIIKVVEDIITLHIKASKGEIESILDNPDSPVWSAARSAIESAIESVASTSARSATRSAAESATWSVTRSAAWSATRSVTWLVARSAIESVTRSPAWSAARSAVESAAWSVTWSDTRSAEWSAAVVKISGKLLELFEKKKCIA